MSDFKAKMHKIRCGSPRPPSCISGGLLLRGGRGKRGDRREREGKGKGRGRDVREREAPNI